MVAFQQIMNPKNWITLASSLLALAVICGAFGAHALRARLDQYSLGIWDKAVFYHFIHAIGILLTALLASAAVVPHTSSRLVCILLTAGIIIFSGSLYLLALTGQRWLGAITPIGGTLFIVAWIVLALAAAR